jgi:Na+-transporting NADH:ubiquinone oxidoreductase subunit C
MTVISATLLSLLASGLSERHVVNELIYNKRATILAVEKKLDKPVKEMSDEEVQAVFNEKIEQFAINMDGEVIEGIIAEEVDMAKEKKKPEADRVLPVYIYKGEKGDNYILSIRGGGLWDEIWGNIALEDDLNTVLGATFDHKAETPGLGAEIKDNSAFPRQFEGKKLRDMDGVFQSIDVVKGGVKNEFHEVDVITGATVTCDGVAEMLQRGLRYYEPYLNKVMSEKN